MPTSEDEEETSRSREAEKATKNGLERNTRHPDHTVNRGCILVTAYFVFLGWRFISLALYSIYATDCFLRAKLATLRCENFTLYPNPTRFEIAWQSCSAVNNFIAIGILFKLPEFPGWNVVSARLVRLARFWSFLFQLVVVISYNLMLYWHEHLAESAIIEVGFIIDEITITAVVCLWNFVPAPHDRSDGFASGLSVAYKMTLVVFFLENFFLFLLMSSQAALDITGIHEFETRSKGLQALGIVFNATEATFYFAVMKFMWNKLFEGDVEDLLKKDTI